MMELLITFITFLDTHNGSLMFLITFVYVVATIVICWANIKSANASKKQLEESVRQYNELNRPYLDYELPMDNFPLYGIRIVNRGTVTARNIVISFGFGSYDSCIESDFRETIEQAHKTQFILGAGQGYNFFFGEDELNVKCVTVRVQYQSSMQAYEDTFFVNLAMYDVDEYLIEPKATRHDRFEQQMIQKTSSMCEALKAIAENVKKE